MHQQYSSVISLNDFHAKVNIGVTEKERNTVQDIKISFKLFFKVPPFACETDDLNDTVCYHKISGIVAEYCKANKVKLLEYFCMQLHKQVRQVVDSSIKIWIKVEKCNPPIEGLVGTTSFEYCDL
jgi:dihydroneopterin aldolase